MRLWEGIYFALNIPVLYFYCVPLFVSGRGEGEDFWLGAWGCAVPEQHGNWGEYCRVTGVGRRTIKCHSAVLVQSWHLTYIWRVNRLVSTSIYKNHLCMGPFTGVTFCCMAAVTTEVSLLPQWRMHKTTNNETWVTYRSGNIAAHKTKKHMPEAPQREECVCHIFLFRYDQTEENDKMCFDFGVRAENCFWQGESPRCCHFTHM